MPHFGSQFPSWEQFVPTCVPNRLTLSFLLALNFFKQSTVSWRCIAEATLSRFWKANRFNLRALIKRHFPVVYWKRLWFIGVDKKHCCPFRDDSIKKLIIGKHTQIQGTFSACSAVMRFFGFTVSMESIRLFASGVTVSHSGLGYWNRSLSFAIQFFRTSYAPALIWAYRRCWSSSQKGGYPTSRM